MSSLNELSILAQRYHLKRTRSSSSSGSSSSSSTSGYGSILSEDEREEDEDQKINDQSQPGNLEQSSLDQHHSNQPSDNQNSKLGINNKGMKLLLKMGWIEGNGLGLTQNGRREPIPTPAQTPLLGLGKATQDAYMLSNAISKPKELESIVIARETEEAKVKREEKVKEIQTRVVEREDRLKTFYCQICDKGYTTITQFEEHERSYAHHHARRAVEAKEARKATGPSTEARLEKERRREAKELERMARAAGMNLDSKPSTLAKSETSKTAGEGLKKPASGWIKLPPPSSSSSSISHSIASSQAEALKLSNGNRTKLPAQTFVGSSSNPPQTDPNATINKAKPSGFKSSGFTPISISSSTSTSSSSGFKPIGRATTDTGQDSSQPSSSLAKLPPTFVASSSVETSFDSSLNQKPEQFETSQNQNPAPTASAQASSKFAQIAARLAARKAAAAAQGVSSTLTTDVKSTPSSHYDPEIEKMLNL